MYKITQSLTNMRTHQSTRADVKCNTKWKNVEMRARCDQNFGIGCMIQIYRYSIQVMLYKNIFGGNNVIQYFTVKPEQVPKHV